VVGVSERAGWVRGAAREITCSAAGEKNCGGESSLWFPGAVDKEQTRQ
jgi:hypothetical protein